MDIPKDKKNVVVLILLIIIGIFVVYYTSIRPMIKKGDDSETTDKNVVAELPTAKTIEIMGKGIDKKIEPVPTEEEEAIKSVFDERIQMSASGEIPPQYDVQITDEASDAERMERILTLQERYRQNNSEFAQEMERRQSEEEKKALQQEANTYKELYEQSVSDNNTLAQRVKNAELEEAKVANQREWLMVTSKKGNVVSSIGGDPETESPFFGIDDKEGKDNTPLRNALKATVQQTITVKNGDILPIRLVEDAYAGNTVLRAGTILNGVVNLKGNRLEVIISNVEYKGRIMKVNLAAYDIDAQKGIYVPDGDLAQTVKEATSALGDGILQASTSASQGFTLNSSAKDAAVGVVTRGVVAGIGGMLKGNDRIPTVTIRSGYKLFLMNEGN